MKIMTYTESRARYAEVLDQVVNDREEIVITRQGHESVVIIALDLAQLRHGNLEEHDLIDIPDEEN